MTRLQQIMIAFLDEVHQSFRHLHMVGNLYDFIHFLESPQCDLDVVVWVVSALPLLLALVPLPYLCNRGVGCGHDPRNDLNRIPVDHLVSPVARMSNIPLHRK